MIIKVGLDEFELSNAEVKALLWDILDLNLWVQNALKNKARQCIDKIVEENSDKQPKKLTVADKEQIILTADIERALKRQKKFEASLNK